nr:hypothetical protein [Candidatus Baldrarchaeota archaeon]
MWVWLKCNQISKGMFPNEIGIEAQNSKGEVFSLFADKQIIKKEDGLTYVRTTLLEKTGNESVIVLPTDPYELQSRIVRVSNSFLKGI